MKKVLNYNGIDYYLFNEFLSEYHGYQHIDERKVFKGTVMSFHNERFITEDTWKAMEYAVHIDKDMISSFNAVDKIFGSGSHMHDNIAGMLDEVIPYEKYEGKHYYKKIDIENFPNISELASVYNGEPLISISDLIKYHNQNRLLHADLLVLSNYHFYYLYPRRRIVEINEMLFIRGNIEDAIDKFEEILENTSFPDFFANYFDGETRYKDTLSLMRGYYKIKVNNSASSNRDKVAKEYVSILYDFYKCLSKNLALYSIGEVKELLENNPAFAKSKVLIQFIEYVRNENKEFLPALTEFRLQASNEKLDCEGILYSPEEFSSIYDAAIDVSRHVINAYNDFTYAQYWLVILLLLTNFIREIDIFNTPIIDYPYSFAWDYFKNNQIHLHEAQAICNHFELNVSNIRISKNNEKKTVHFLQDQIEAVAVAIIICNDHAKKKALPKLFSMRSIDSKRIYAKLGEPFYNIGNRKMNYTLATFFEDVGNKANIYRKSVYSFLSYMRGHRMSTPLSPSDTTLLYIKAANSDTSATEISYHTVSRGIFGWLYHMMLDYVGETFSSLDEETERIINLQEKYNPNNIEQLSDYLMHEKIVRMNVLKMLNSFSKGDIKLFLQDIGTPITIKGAKEFPCIFGRNCPKACSDCAYCEYSIKTVHSLLVYRDEIERILSVLNTTNSTYEIKKNMYLLFKILIVIKDFKHEFDDVDKDYINAFIDIKEIKARMDLLPPLYTKLLGDVINGECH